MQCWAPASWFAIKRLPAIDGKPKNRSMTQWGEFFKKWFIVGWRYKKYVGNSRHLLGGWSPPYMTPHGHDQCPIPLPTSTHHPIPHPYIAYLHTISRLPSPVSNLSSLVTHLPSPVSVKPRFTFKNKNLNLTFNILMKIKRGSPCCQLN